MNEKYLRLQECLSEQSPIIFFPLSVFLLTDSLTHSCLVDLNEVNLADEDDYLMKAIDSLVEILKLSRGCVVQ